MNVSFAKKRHASSSLWVSANLSVLFRRAALLAVTSSLVGCGMGSVSGTGSIASAVNPATAGQPQISGKVHGGQFPVTGAYIQLYAVGTSGYGVGATPLIATATASDSTTQSTVQTDSNGDFTLTGQYTCPGSNPLVYLTAVGGNPGLTTGTNNTQIAMVAALGKCNSLTTTQFITVNEVTTVAAVWALQGFIGYNPAQSLYSNGGAYPSTAATGFAVGSSSTNAVGLANAFKVASVLANTSTGTSPGTNVSGHLKSIEASGVNLLGNILSSCVNSAGGVAGDGSNCGNLLNDVVPPTYYNVPTAMQGTPKDCLQAAYLIARNPANNVTTIAGLAPASGAPFNPAANTFNDFTIGYAIGPQLATGYGNGATASTAILGSPVYLAVDLYGNVWAANADSDGTGGSNGATTTAPYIPFLAEFDPLGNLLAKVSQYYVGGALQYIGSTAGVTQPAGGTTPIRIAIDASNNVYATDPANGNLFAITGSSGPGTTDAAVYTTNAIATGITGVVSGAWISTPEISSFVIDSNSNLWLESSTGGSASFPGQKVLALPLSSFTSGSAPTVTVGASVTGGGTVGPFAIDNTSSSSAAGAPYLWADYNGYCPGVSLGSTGNYGYLLPVNTVATTTPAVKTAGAEATFKGVVSLGVSTTSCSTTNYPNSLSPVTVSYNSTSYQAAPIAGPLLINFDSNNGMWLLNLTDAAASSGTYSTTNNLSVAHLTPTYNATGSTVTFTDVAEATGGSLSYTGGTGGTASGATQAAVDGSNNYWVSTQNSGSPSEFTYSSANGETEVAPLTTGFKGNTCTSCTGIAYPAGAYRGYGTARAVVVDRSGNVWIPQSNTNGNSITVIVGAATPVSTPLLPGSEGFLP